jgi:KipI family sensor histidine kinase inhibitor
MGERALLAETDDTATALALYEQLIRHPLQHQTAVVPGGKSVLIRFSQPIDTAGPVGNGDLSGSSISPVEDPFAARLLGDGAVTLLQPAEQSHRDGAGVVIDVVYDGADLDEVGRLTGLGPDGVVTAHTTTPWRVAFCGFSPGFGYLVCGDSRLDVPRRRTPRHRVPAGSVGLADGYSGVYPTASPGGWQLIGRTTAPLWDLDRDPPALLRPGITVHFRAVREAATVTPFGTAPESHPPATSSGGRSLTVVKPGIQCTTQDLGRPGLADMGVSPSGAADRGAAMRADRIVGNGVGAAVLEILLGGAEFRAEADLLLTVTGAAVDLAILGSDGTHQAGMDRPVPVAAGGRIRLGRPSTGLRSYLAVRGGIAVPPVLGSRSTDLLSGIGPPVVRSGDVLPIGEEHWGTPHPVAGPDLLEPGRLEIMPGPQADWLADGIEQALPEGGWTVSPSSNRVGIRLTGPDLRRRADDALPSQGLVRGAVQLPPSGELVVFLADHPVTGGYPVVGVLTDDAADRAAQLRPGEVVTFVVAG